jgi:hypothetical protein
MKINLVRLCLSLALLALSTINSHPSTAHAQTPAGTVFTYDGKLEYGGSPVGSPLPITAVGVTNGLFTIPRDFGGVFTGNSMRHWVWLQTRNKRGVGSTKRHRNTPVARGKTENGQENGLANL